MFDIIMNGRFGKALFVGLLAFPAVAAAQSPVSQDSSNMLCYNTYCKLLDDDTNYNPKEHWIYPALKVFANDALTWALDRYALNKDYARVNMQSWGRNLDKGWWWDNDPIQANFIGHPYSGGISYAGARSSGYGFYSSFAFSATGSLVWEYFGETEQPSYNDIICTPLTGVFFGEIMHRLSSNILDDRSRGSERVLREIFAGTINPVRGLSRLVNGKAWRHVAGEIYQKEPMDVNLYTGVDVINHGTMFGTGALNPAFKLQCIYGDPYEFRRRKPYDYFRLNVDFVYRTGRSPLDNILGYGLLAGGNLNENGKADVFAGAFQYFDYWNDHFFELSTLGFGGSILTRVPIARHSALSTSLSFAALPLAAFNLRNSWEPDPDHREYSYSGGMQLKLESVLEINRQCYVSVAAHGYLTRGYYGKDGDNATAILNPAVQLRLYKGLFLGVEEYVFYNHNLSSAQDATRVAGEQKILIRYSFEKIRKAGDRLPISD